MTSAGTILAEGKTKQIVATDNLSVVDVVSKDDITAGDGLQHDLMAGKKVHATNTTCNVFQLLRNAGIPNHFVSQIDDVTFRARHLDMIPLELVARRTAFGSFIKRNPGVARGTNFPNPLIEFFYKDDELSPPEAGLDTQNDPLVVFDCVSGQMLMYKPKRPLAAGFIDVVSFADIDWLPDDLSKVARLIEQLRLLTARTFLLLERSWAQLGLKLADFKIEAGRDVETSNLMVGDVIDNDSWRLWLDGDITQMLDKEVYRQLDSNLSPAERAAALADIGDNYAHVALLSESLR